MTRPADPHKAGSVGPRWILDTQVQTWDLGLRFGAKLARV